MRPFKRIRRISALLATAPAAAVATQCMSVSWQETPPFELRGVVMITDGGSVEDNSFNEEAFNAFKSLDPTGTVRDVMKSASSLQSEILRQYDAVEAIGKRNLVMATGFSHKTAIESYLSRPVAPLHFMLLDEGYFDNNSDENGKKRWRQVTSVTFKVFEPAFVIGYSVGLYLKDLNRSKPTETPHRSVGTWGGLPYPGVANFIHGFVAGIRAFNESNENTDEKHSIRFHIPSSFDAFSQTYFEKKSEMAEANAKSMVRANVDVIMPVAGPQTASVLEAIRTANKQGKVEVIGVDTDQSFAYPADASMFLSSVMKNIQGAYEATFADLTSTDQNKPTTAKFGTNFEASFLTTHKGQPLVNVAKSNPKFSKYVSDENLARLVALSRSPEVQGWKFEGIMRDKPSEKDPITPTWLYMLDNRSN